MDGRSNCHYGKRKRIGNTLLGPGGSRNDWQVKGGEAARWKDVCIHMEKQRQEGKSRQRDKNIEEHGQKLPPPQKKT